MHCCMFERGSHSVTKHAEGKLAEDTVLYHSTIMTPGTGQQQNK